MFYLLLSYVNLSASGGPYYIGQTLPQLLIGSVTPGTSPINGTAGWAFEVVFKATAQLAWSKVFDIGNFQPNNDQYCINDIVFGWNGGNANQVSTALAHNSSAALPHLAPSAPARNNDRLSFGYL